ncbi:MAG TPA: hypothetical protein VMV45_03785 [Casimicrobiaceae bacterium]|nr:hypothetical protein [Casimicrobiaceae bacterium]
MRSMFRKMVLWFALALFAGVGLAVEIAPRLVQGDTVRHVASECGCIASLKLGDALATLRDSSRHCRLSEEAGSWLDRPTAVASALGPFMIF